MKTGEGSAGEVEENGHLISKLALSCSKLSVQYSYLLRPQADGLLRKRARQASQAGQCEIPAMFVFLLFARS